MKIELDLGNKNYKLKVGDKRIIDNSNIEEVLNGTFGAWEINEKSYIASNNAKAKKNTNKITLSKSALLGRALYPVVEDGAEVDLVTLLPLSLYVNKENRDKFANLLKGDYKVANPNGATKCFIVRSVEVFCEGFSSLILEPSLLSEPIFLVDFGGVDVSGVFVNGTPDTNRMFTSEKGMNIFFEGLGKEITSKTLSTCTEKDAELYFNKYESLPNSLQEIIDAYATDYVNENIVTPLADKGYNSIIHKLVCVGGGAIALNKYLEEIGAVTLKNALWSNVEGAAALSRLRGSN